jgi:glycosyltransferase involved in cell wall biosynthesis
VNIALVVPGGVDRSGEYRVIPALLALVKRLAERDHVQVFALRQEAQRATWELAGARIHNVGRPWTRVRGIAAICAVHRAARFDLVHSVWSAACGVVAVGAARILKLPSLVHVAGGELVALREIEFGGRLTWLGRAQEALVLAGATAVTAASAPMLESLSRLGARGQRVPLGVDLGTWPAREPLRRDARHPARLVHVGSLNRVKDQPTLLRALAEIARAGIAFEADIIGEDTLQGSIQRLAQDLGLTERVRFHGFLTQRQLRPLILQAHLMLVSSHHEAGPLAMLEAAVLGVPTVGTRVGHIAEWAPAAALAVPVGDWRALASAARALLQDEERRLAIAREAFQRAVREDADYTAQRFRHLYTDLAPHTR